MKHDIIESFPSKLVDDLVVVLGVALVLGYCHSSQYPNDSDHDHELNQGEPFLRRNGRGVSDKRHKGSTQLSCWQRVNLF